MGGGTVFSLFVSSPGGGGGYLPWTGGRGGYLPWMWGVGTPSRWMGVPLPERQSSTANTTYAAGGMPLALTQEDFLVLWLKWNERVTTYFSIADVQIS